MQVGDLLYAIRKLELENVTDKNVQNEISLGVCLYEKIADTEKKQSLVLKNFENKRGVLKTFHFFNFLSRKVLMKRKPCSFKPLPKVSERTGRRLPPAMVIGTVFRTLTIGPCLGQSLLTEWIIPKS